MTIEKTEAQKFADGLRQLAAMIETYPGMPLPSPYLFVYGASPAQLVEIARARGANDTRKEYAGETFTLIKEFEGGIQVHFSINREQVCRRVVKEVIEVPETIEPEQVIPARVIAAHTCEVVEWECHPLLAPPEKRQLEEVTA